MGNLEISHDILIAGTDFESCRKRVNHFYDSTMLIRYDQVRIEENVSINGTEKGFSTRLQEGLAANQKAVRELLDNLRDEGFETFEDIQGVEKGYVSKMFHTIAHLLDGFIGIDSRFYNLEEDSHGISRDLQEKILSAPQNYWILKVNGRIASADEDSLHALRTFEWKGKDND
jgi:hypothetical protein